MFEYDGGGAQPCRTIRAAGRRCARQRRKTAVDDDAHGERGTFRERDDENESAVETSAEYIILAAASFSFLFHGSIHLEFFFFFFRYSPSLACGEKIVFRLNATVLNRRE